jgi:hypothetical protein
VPALYLAQPFTGNIAAIGFGVLSEAQMLEPIVTVASPQAERMPSTAISQTALPQIPEEASQVMRSARSAPAVTVPRTISIHSQEPPRAKFRSA